MNRCVVTQAVHSWGGPGLCLGYMIKTVATNKLLNVKNTDETYVSGASPVWAWHLSGEN